MQKHFDKHDKKTILCGKKTFEQTFSEKKEKVTSAVTSIKTKSQQK